MKIFRRNFIASISTLSLIFLIGCAATGEKKTDEGLKTQNDHPTAFPKTMQQISQELLRPGSGDDWKPDSALAREIQQHKLDLAELIEDANWVLALNAALDGTLPDSVKNSLRLLHESYAENAPHEDIAKQVGELLPKIPDERLRREMKKLANRSWDRDRRTNPAHLPAVVKADNHPLQTPPRQPTKIDTAIAVSTDTSIQQTKNRVDTLMAQGKYPEALRALETIEDKTDTAWIKSHRRNLGNRYCEQERSFAANAFVASRKAKKESLRNQYLQQSLSDLDSCLFQFPDAPVAEKVRSNRALVEKELNR